MMHAYHFQEDHFSAPLNLYRKKNKKKHKTICQKEINHSLAIPSIYHKLINFMEKNKNQKQQQKKKKKKLSVKTQISSPIKSNFHKLKHIYDNFSFFYFPKTIKRADSPFKNKNQN